MSLLSLVKKREPAFINDGMKNWKKALEKFADHEHSSCHLHAVLQLSQHKSAPVCAQLSQQLAQDQQECRRAFVAVLSTMRYLARQGIALRGHSSDAGNYQQLLSLRSEDVPEL